MTKERILSGMRSSGALHLGNLLGALQNWVGAAEGLRGLLLYRPIGTR